ncbi:MAG TPA: hypothetical protein VH165_00200 [Kofleriaceae bacterium]|jgi:hypothetical protein|nr:hypothetical protein [Kofleriaceae bacterium]
MRTLAVLLFIAAVAGVAIHLAQRPTIADGRVMEADLLVQLRKNGVHGLRCDREIPIGKRGAVFTCLATLDNGGTQTIEYTMDRAGQLTAKLLALTGATHAPTREPTHAPARDRIPTSGDPWGN